MKRSSGLAWALLLLAIGLGSYWRAAPIPGDFLFGDEFLTLRPMLQGYGHILTTFGSWGIPQPLLQRLLTDLIGFNHWAIRLPALLGGIATLGCVFVLGRRLIGRAGAIVATFLIAANSFHIFYSGFARFYTLLGLAGLCLVVNLAELVRSRRWRFRDLTGLALLVATLGYVHPAAAIGVAAMGLGAALALLSQRRTADLLKLGGGFAAGALICLLLYAPALESFLTVSGAHSRPLVHVYFELIDVAAVIAGSRTAGWLLLAITPIASVFAVIRWGPHLLPVAMAPVGALILLYASHPTGGAYAYARYLMTVTPCLALLVGGLLSGLIERIAGSRAEVVTLAVGAVVAALAFGASPYGLRRASDGPYGHSYSSLYQIPAYEIPYDGGSPFYQGLAREDVAIIEAPAILTHQISLYRAYYLGHQKPTQVAIIPRELEQKPTGPYVSLFEPLWQRHTDADYLIVHYDLPREYDRYWRFMLERDPALLSGPDADFMRSKEMPPADRSLERLRMRLRREIGDPVYRDAEIEVWELARRNRHAGGDR